MSLLIGIGWMAFIGLTMGMHYGGDTLDYATRVQQLFTEGHPLATLYSEQNLTAHITTVWMALLGAKGFVILTVVLTAFVPWLLLKLLRQMRVRTFYQVGALLFLATNPEIYKWAWYILTDGFFIANVTLLFVLITRRTYPRAWLWLLPVVLYHLVYIRPTAFLVLPALLVYGWLAQSGWQRKLLLGMGTVLLLWHVGWLAGTGGTSGDHLGITRDMLVRGELLNDPDMSEPVPVPFAPDAVEGMGIVDIIKAYPAYSLRFYAQKLVTFFWPVYPKYSPKHNLFNALYFGALLSLSFTGIGVLVFRRFVKRTLSLNQEDVQTLALYGTLMLTLGAFHTITHTDPDTRFLIVWVPLWICGTALLWSCATGKSTASAVH